MQPERPTSRSMSLAILEHSPSPSPRSVHLNELPSIDYYELPDNSRDYAASPPTEPELHDEELPSYDEVNLPGYRERHEHTPVVSYCIYQIARRFQTITPSAIDTLHRPRYRVSARRSSLFSKKADFILTRVPAGRATALGECKETNVATMSFDKHGKLPWMPRATISHITSEKSYPMASPNFHDWKFMIDTEPFVWTITDRPASLILVERLSESIVARFSYSTVGTCATRGAEIGRLDIYGGSRSEDQDFIELVLASCQIAIDHYKSTGRHYRSDVTPRSCSIATSASGNSFSAQAATSSIGGPRPASTIL